MNFKVTKLSQPHEIEAQWNKKPWSKIKALTLNNYMGKTPSHTPLVSVKLATDNACLYVIFQVEDKYIKSVAQNYQDNVCKDSCVEFFFSPGDSLGKSYFNFEVNCGGTALFYWHPEGKNKVPISLEDFQKVKLAHTLPKIIETEIKEPCTWAIEYALPFEVIKKYCPEACKPEKGVIWKCNFYKCADNSSQPHWLTWSQVEHPTPKFHLPEFFGRLEFE
jgi:hypothetical protein